jgi:uncharacterized membrane protein YidH (DUF202 family)
MNRNYIKTHMATISIAIFICIFSIMTFSKPAVIYNNDGSLRNFGIGFKRKTICPAWLFAVVIAILSYFSVMYYVAVPKIQF